MEAPGRGRELRVAAAAALAWWAAVVLLRCAPQLISPDSTEAHAVSAAAAAQRVEELQAQLTGDVRYVAIQSATSGRYVEVRSDSWLYASTYSPTKPSALFELVRPSDELVASLLLTRAFVERSSTESRSRWDMRGGDSASTESLESILEAKLVPTDAVDPPPASDVGGWILLRSNFAGGFISVHGRAEADEYVVKVSSDGSVSYRSLLRISGDALWSAHGGYLNFREAAPGERAQPLRAHGNREPWRLLREPVDSARAFVRPALRATGRLLLHSLHCPLPAPPFEWNLLLDAARAGACNGAAPATLQRAAAAATALEAQLGAGFGAELPEMIAAYRQVLLSPEWEGTLDLQLQPCADFNAPFSSSKDGRLHIDTADCPHAGYAEAVLLPSADGLAGPEPPQVREVPSASDGGGTDSAAGVPDVALESDGVLVQCEESQPRGDGEFTVSEEGGESLETAGFTSLDETEWQLGEGEEQPLAPVRQNLWLRPRRLPTEAAGRQGPASADAGVGVSVDEVPSVLLLMIDATSWAHLRRMCPRALAFIEGMSRAGGVRAYTFERYSIVGYNSVPNMVPLLTGIDAATFLAQQTGGFGVGLGGSEAPIDWARAWGIGGEWGGTADPQVEADARPEGESDGAAADARAEAPVNSRFAVDGADAIWNTFKARGDATFLLEEIHDGCNDISTSGTSAAAKLFTARLGETGMPDHNPWRIFCQPELRPCCHDPDSFLRPGRRQCVNGADLHKELLRYGTEVFAMYRGGSDVGDGAAADPRRRVMGLLNLMSGHEHFMTRLAALDDDLLAFLKGFEGRLRSDTALFLLADHGTHGIWYNDFAIGQAEHRAPALQLLLPAGFVAAHPTVDGALRRNQRRRVTAFDLHATLRHLASWPAMPSPTVEATSLFVDLPDGRSCEQARVPAEWCLETQDNCFESAGGPAGVD